MFGLPSFPKILVILLIVVVGWMALRRWSAGAGKPPSRPSANANARARPKQAEKTIEDMKPCRICGAFVAPAAKSCGRADCPY